MFVRGAPCRLRGHVVRMTTGGPHVPAALGDHARERQGPILRLMSMKARILTAVVVLSLAGCTSGASSDARSGATHPATGNDAKTVEVSGDFLMSGGPYPGKDVPLSGTVVFESSDTTLRVTVGRSGHFQVSVPLGRYQVTGASPHINGGQTQCRQVAPLDARPGGVNNVHVICFVA